ncbi:Heat shock protein 82, partial [Giardia duodenalis]
VSPSVTGGACTARFWEQLCARCGVLCVCRPGRPPGQGRPGCSRTSSAGCAGLGEG